MEAVETSVGTSTDNAVEFVDNDVGHLRETCDDVFQLFIFVCSSNLLICVAFKVNEKSHIYPPYVCSYLRKILSMSAYCLDIG